MQTARFYYLIHVQFLGFRYSGWQKQPDQKTVEGMLVKTLKFVLPNSKFKILGAGRTDAKVSALNTAFELFLDKEPLEDLQEFMHYFNVNLPPDIRIISIEEVNEKFNVIQESKLKEYVYLFSFGQKNHPFCAPFLANILDELDVDAMSDCARYFIGTHDFSSYTARLQPNTKVLRTIATCEIKRNEILTANFFPELSYALHISGEGFMRYQIRMIMGALIQLGKGELTAMDIKESLKKDNNRVLTYVAPGSGLLLNHLQFQKLGNKR
ncbi:MULTISPECIES: tRNA pseudouridine(38-40) synthase TruA [unclassified Arenibacter]|jgi:tRNA pseudouridine38-40 synthase|uniref:tRNA pseudouridine(38-40) synthase TruA n=1 Tax=unclassified Arenibacter TaxID=2615047 RepID=UPI000E353562|nr:MULTISPECIES: tRNA pseudouridine(38-40) synthase TruA [unclassified Arenibacter]MCM4163148.1 tRNA pseudouridine(38-40) synthase TruA [Arenibacter sp. A80]RFT57177.1 tRNA pseudouridine(38-40) synthase TruA [Arenibacter sp. P308M17]